MEDKMRTKQRFFLKAAGISLAKVAGISLALVMAFAMFAGCEQDTKIEYRDREVPGGGGGGATNIAPATVGSTESAPDVADIPAETAKTTGTASAIDTLLAGAVKTVIYTGTGEVASLTIENDETLIVSGSLKVTTSLTVNGDGSIVAASGGKVFKDVSTTYTLSKAANETDPPITPAGLSATAEQNLATTGDNAGLVTITLTGAANKDIPYSADPQSVYYDMFDTQDLNEILIKERADAGYSAVVIKSLVTPGQTGKIKQYNQGLNMWTPEIVALVNATKDYNTPDVYREKTYGTGADAYYPSAIGGYDIILWNGADRKTVTLEVYQPDTSEKPTNTFLIDYSGVTFTVPTGTGKTVSNVADVTWEGNIETVTYTGNTALVGASASAAFVVPTGKTLVIAGQVANQTAEITVANNATLEIVSGASIDLGTQGKITITTLPTPPPTGAALGEVKNDGTIKTATTTDTTLRTLVGFEGDGEVVLTGEIATALTTALDLGTDLTIGTNGKITYASGATAFSGGKNVTLSGSGAISLGSSITSLGKTVTFVGATTGTVTTANTALTVTELEALLGQTSKLTATAITVAASDELTVPAATALTITTLNVNGAGTALTITLGASGSTIATTNITNTGTIKAAALATLLGLGGIEGNISVTGASYNIDEDPVLDDVVLVIPSGQTVTVGDEITGTGGINNQLGGIINLGNGGSISTTTKTNNGTINTGTDSEGTLRALVAFAGSGGVVWAPASAEEIPLTSTDLALATQDLTIGANATLNFGTFGLTISGDGGITNSGTINTAATSGDTFKKILDIGGTITASGEVTAIVAETKVKDGSVVTLTPAAKLTITNVTLTVDGNGTLDLSGLNAADSVTLTGTGKIEVASNGTLKVPAPVTDSTSQNYGKTPQIKYDGGSILLKGGSSAYFVTKYYIGPSTADAVYKWAASDTTSTVTLKGGEIELAGNLTLAQNEYILHTATIASGTLTVANGATLTVVDGAELTGNGNLTATAGKVVVDKDATFSVVGTVTGDVTQVVDDDYTLPTGNESSIETALWGTVSSVPKNHLDDSNDLLISRTAKKDLSTANNGVVTIYLTGTVTDTQVSEHSVVDVWFGGKEDEATTLGGNYAIVTIGGILTDAAKAANTEVKHINPSWAYYTGHSDNAESALDAAATEWPWTYIDEDDYNASHTYRQYGATSSDEWILLLWEAPNTIDPAVEKKATLEIKPDGGSVYKVIVDWTGLTINEATN
jgi:hypothetical protein